MNKDELVEKRVNEIDAAHGCEIYSYDTGYNDGAKWMYEYLVKNLDLQNVTHSEAVVCIKAKHQYRAKYRSFKYCPDCGCKLQTDG